MPDYYIVPSSPARPGNVAVVADDSRFQCTPSNPFGPSKQNPSMSQLRANDGTSRTETQFLIDQMKSDQDFLYAMNPLILPCRAIFSLTPVGKAIDIAWTLRSLHNDNLTEVAIDVLAQQIVGSVVGNELVSATLKQVVSGAISRLAENSNDKSEQKEWLGQLAGRGEPKGWSKEQDNTQRAVDQGEQRQRSRPGDQPEMLA